MNFELDAAAPAARDRARLGGRRRRCAAAARDLDRVAATCRAPPAPRRARPCRGADGSPWPGWWRSRRSRPCRAASRCDAALPGAGERRAAPAVWMGLRGVDVDGARGARAAARPASSPSPRCSSGWAAAALEQRARRTAARPSRRRAAASSGIGHWPMPPPSVGRGAAAARGGPRARVLVDPPPACTAAMARMQARAAAESAVAVAAARAGRRGRRWPAPTLRPDRAAMWRRPRSSSAARTAGSGGRRRRAARLRGPCQRLACGSLEPPTAQASWLSSRRRRRERLAVAPTT